MMTALLAGLSAPGRPKEDLFTRLLRLLCGYPYMDDNAKAGKLLIQCMFFPSTLQWNYKRTEGPAQDCAAWGKLRLPPAGQGLCDQRSKERVKCMSCQGGRDEV